MIPSSLNLPSKGRCVTLDYSIWLNLLAYESACLGRLIGVSLTLFWAPWHSWTIAWLTCSIYSWSLSSHIHSQEALACSKRALLFSFYRYFLELYPCREGFQLDSSTSWTSRSPRAAWLAWVLERRVWFHRIARKCYMANISQGISHWSLIYCIHRQFSFLIQHVLHPYLSYTMYSLPR